MVETSYNNYTSPKKAVKNRGEIIIENLDAEFKDSDDFRRSVEKESQKQAMLEQLSLKPKDLLDCNTLNVNVNTVIAYMLVGSLNMSFLSGDGISYGSYTNRKQTFGAV